MAPTGGVWVDYITAGADLVAMELRRKTITRAFVSLSE